VFTIGAKATKLENRKKLEQKISQATSTFKAQHIYELQIITMFYFNFIYSTLFHAFPLSVCIYISDTRKYAQCFLCSSNTVCHAEYGCKLFST